jgi:hypothetical protein
MTFMRLLRPGRLTALAVLALLGAGAATASASTPGNDCCFARAVAVSDPVPTGDVRFGPVVDGFPHVLVRQADGTVLAGRWADERFAAPVAVGRWPYRDLLLGDVDGDVLDDLVGADGAGTVVIGRATATGFAAPAPFARLPRAYSALRMGDTNGDDAADVVGLDPRSRTIRVLQAPGTTDAATLEMGRWPKGSTFQLADLDGDGQADAIGVDAGGRVHVGFNQGTRFAAAHADWHLAAHVSLAVADVTGDGRPDLVYRRVGSDDVYVRRTYDTGGGKNAARIATSFHSARRWGRWDRRLALTTAYLSGPRASLAARDTRTGRIIVARSTARLR